MKAFYRKRAREFEAMHKYKEAEKAYLQVGGWVAQGWECMTDIKHLIDRWWKSVNGGLHWHQTELEYPTPQASCPAEACNCFLASPSADARAAAWGPLLPMTCQPYLSP